jgi:AcrR family transcriptional regulator
MRTVPRQLAGKLYAAADLIAEHGLDNTKIDDIAEATGIPKATLYYYFTGKEEILTFLLNDMLAAITDGVAVALEAPGTARDRLIGAVTAQLCIMLQHPAACRALVGDLGRATRLPTLAAALRTAFDQPIEQLLRDGAEDGTLHAGPDPTTSALVVFGAVTIAGLVHSVEATNIEPDVLATKITDVLLTGIGDRSASAVEP